MIRFLTDLYLLRKRKQSKSVFAVLEKEYRVSIDDEVITVPAGFETDLASIPRRLRGIVSLDRGVEAAIIHDWLYAKNIGTRKKADEIFKRLLDATEGFATANAMYWSVRLFGWGPWKRAQE